jgi:hypothetical protein
VVTLAATKGKGRQICDKIIGSVLHGINNFLLHSVFIFSLIFSLELGNHNLEGHILLLFDVRG